MSLQPRQFSIQILPTWEGTIDSRYLYGFLDGSGISIDYDHEPAEWDYALMVYKIAKKEDWTREKAQEEVRRFKMLVRRGERPGGGPKPVGMPSNAVERQQAYWIALGLFVNEFRELGRMNRRTARALFPHPNAGELLRKINQLLKIGDEPSSWITELKEVLPQLETINSARNSILHSGWHYSKTGKMVSSNLRGALHPKDVREHSAEPETLDNMRADLGKIHNHFFLFMWRNLKVEAAEVEQLRKETQVPWLYKLEFKAP
jgi:hypothetical protein